MDRARPHQGDPLDRLLDRIDRDAGEGNYAAIVAAPSAMVDLVSARLASGRVELLVDDGANGAGGDPGARVAALALALSMPRGVTHLSDVASDGSAARLRQLTDEVGRIAATLARLSAGPGVGGNGARGTDGAGMLGLRAGTGSARDDTPPPEISQDVLRTVIRARRLRSRYFSEELFADPAWDMRSNRSEILIRSKGIRCIPGSALVITHRDPNPSGVNGDPRSTGRAIPKQQSKAAPMAGPPLARVRSPPRSPLRSDRGVSEGRALTGCRAPAALRNGALNRRLLVEHQPVLKGTP